MMVSSRAQVAISERKVLQRRKRVEFSSRKGEGGEGEKGDATDLKVLRSILVSILPSSAGFADPGGVPFPVI